MEVSRSGCPKAGYARTSTVNRTLRRVYVGLPRRRLSFFIRHRNREDVVSRIPVASKGRKLVAALIFASAIVPSALRADSFTLQQLIQLGSQGVIVGDKQFYDFSYVGSPTPSAGIQSPAPTADQIVVVPGTVPTLGLSFSAGWASAVGLNQDSLISYRVHVLDGTPQQLIDGVGLAFNGAAPLTGPLANAAVTEKIEALDGTVLGQFGVFNDGTNAPDDRLQNSITLHTPTRDLLVVKDVMVHSSTDGGVSTISLVDNTFHQVATPLPHSVWAGLLLIDGLAAWAAVQRRALASRPSGNLRHKPASRSWTEQSWR